LGFSITESASKVITGVTISTLLAVVARVGVEVS